MSFYHSLMNPAYRAIKGMVSAERRAIFQQAVDYANYEMVAGDVLEFGVFTGRTLAALTYSLSHSQYNANLDRRVIGFDSFDGLPSSIDVHPRWTRDNCTVNHLNPTPAIGKNEHVSEHAVRKLFGKLKLRQPDLITGDFAETIPGLIPSQCSAAAIVHIDCDIYESARTVLFGIAPILQEGTILLFDDWFHYKSHPGKGEQRALCEFIEAHPQWRAAHYRTYGLFCNAFIMTAR